MIRFLKISVSLLALAAIAGAVLGYRTYHRQLALVHELDIQRAGATAVAQALDLSIDGWDAALADASRSEHALQQLALHAEQTVAARETARTELAAAREHIQVAEKEQALTAAELHASRADAEALADALAAEKQALQSTRDRVAVLEADVAAHLADLERLERRHLTTRDDLLEVTEERDYYKGIVQAEAPGAIADRQAAGEARVLSSRPELGFVVIDKGRRDLLEPGLTALVHRNEQLLGRVRITRTQPDLAVAEVEPGWEIAEIQPGDQLLMEHALHR